MSLIFLELFFADLGASGAGEVGAASSSSESTVSEDLTFLPREFLRAGVSAAFFEEAAFFVVVVGVFGALDLGVLAGVSEVFFVDLARLGVLSA